MTEFSLFPRRPATARPKKGAAPAARARAAAVREWTLAETLVEALRSPLEPGRAALQVSNSLAVRQVFFTGFEALPLVSVIAAMVGVTIVMQMQLMGAELPGEIVGRIIVATVLRELAPLTTTVIVASRSGTAIATELGNMRVGAEIVALQSLGIDPMRFIVWPRIVGTVVSVLVLTVYFGMVAILSGYLMDSWLGGSTFAALQSGFSEALVPLDALLFLTKCSGLGLLIGWLSCHYGLEVRVSPTEVPQKASQAVVTILLVSVIFSTAVTAAFYMLVGPPIR